MTLNPSNAAQGLSILLINQTWFAEELRTLGHKVITAGWTDAKYDVLLKKAGLTIADLCSYLPRGFRPDRVVYLDNSGPLGILGLEDLNIPSLFYSVDAHHHHTWHPHFSGVFDAVFVAQKDYLGQFERFNKQVQWFPLWAPIDISPQEGKTIDVCFRGNLDSKLHPKRAKFFDELAQLVPVDARTDHYTVAYPRSKIVLNQVVKGDLNFRTFEAMMSGALLITPQIKNGLEELFEPNVDLVLYQDGNPRDAAEKIRYYLEHENDRLRLAENGRKKIIQYHTPMHRARALEQFLFLLEVTSRPLKHLGIATAALVSSRFCKGKLDDLSEKMLHVFAQALHQCLNDHDAFIPELERAVILCKLELENAGLQDRALALMKDFLAAHSTNLIFAMGYLESIQKLYGTEEALKHSAQFSVYPEVFLEESSRIMNVVRQAEYGAK